MMGWVGASGLVEEQTQAGNEAFGGRLGGCSPLGLMPSLLLAVKVTLRDPKPPAGQIHQGLPAAQPALPGSG